MSDFQYFNVSIRGLAPGLLMSNGQMADKENWFAARVAELSGKRAAGEEVERQAVKYHVMGRLYLDPDKRIVIPFDMISSALRKGASNVNVKKGRSWWGGITVTGDAPLIVEDLPAWDVLHEDARFVHRCIARNADRSPSPRYRPYFRQWSAVVPIELDPTVVDKGIAEAIFKATGKVVGFGDWRPSSPKNPGKFGRFAVENIAEVAEELPLAA